MVEPARGVEKQEDACRAIEDQVRRSLQTISRQTARAGSVALKTALTLDAELLSKGISIISSELGNAITQANAGLVDAVKKVIQTAARLLLQAYDWVLNLIGKDAESAMRKKVKEWVDELQKDHVEGEDDEPTLMEKLVTRVYATQQINDEVKNWTQNTQAEAQALIDTCTALKKLSAGYEVKAGQVQGACNAVSKARTLALAASGVFPVVAGVLPYLELLSGAVSLGLLGYSLFSGYDYVDSGTVNLFNRFQVRFPDRVEGVRETAMKVLVKA
jgi:methyl-accepting chemotaxis protein